jgi:2-methylcitrate dehydratase PrpD
MNSQETYVTREAGEFVSKLQFEDLPSEALRIGKRCVLDGLGVILAGSSQECAEIVRKYSQAIGQAKESTIFGKQPVKAPAALAVLVNGTAGHAMDWDDTQVSVAPDRMYGLLTHPTIPPLTACLAVSEKLGHVSGKMFLTAFLAGFEVECKILAPLEPPLQPRKC